MRGCLPVLGFLEEADLFLSLMRGAVGGRAERGSAEELISLVLGLPEVGKLGQEWRALSIFW